MCQSFVFDSILSFDVDYYYQKLLTNIWAVGEAVKLLWTKSSLLYFSCQFNWLIRQLVQLKVTIRTI